MALALLLILALAAQEEPRYKFSTTVYTFGTTVASNSGFRGDIYFVEEGREKLPDFARLKPVGSIYTPALCVPGREFEEGFPGVTDRIEWFAIDYHARFWVSQPGAYRFALESDDGSILYIDGKRVIRNDGQHAVLEKDGRVSLKRGAHRIRVSYFQGPRFHVALVLRVRGPKDPEMRVFNTEDFKPPSAGDWR
jgi:PA14 domain